MNKKTLVLLTLLSITNLFSQGFLRTQDKEIINDNGPVLLRSIGTGNWLIQEGYMMQSTDAGIQTHTHFRNKLQSVIGEDKTNTFYKKWNKNHFRKSDLDSMKVWGFNSLRVAMHYKWFTLPIEEESIINGELQNTWLNDGFETIDELLSWCAQNQMYLILDMHGAPGGQGKNAAISDYDETKPSLWESEENKKKLIALWVKLAERYKDSEWIGGYDLINETNWGLEGCANKNGCGCTNNNSLWDLHKRIIEEIRTVDTNHIVYISGNCWGNNYESFDVHPLKNADNNMALTFHKYWNNNNDESISDWISTRDTYNLPIWMSESGENSNTWFSDAISLFEKNNIGWSWWPVKKSKYNNIFKVTTNPNYTNLINAWKNNVNLSVDETYSAVMEYMENHKTENTTIAYDVIYAMINQPGNNNTKPFKNHTIITQILFADYDMGKDGYSYYDKVSADYHIDGGDWATWNSGKYYRNDGVDIGNANGTPYVGWTETGEWIQYTVTVPQAEIYDIEINSSALNNGSLLTIEVNNTIVKDNIALPNTDGLETWQKTIVENISLPQGDVKIKFHFKKGGSNLLDFSIINPSGLQTLDLNTNKEGTIVYPSILKVEGRLKIIPNNKDNFLNYKLDISTTNGELIKSKDVNSLNDLIIKLDRKGEFILTIKNEKKKYTFKLIVN